MIRHTDSRPPKRRLAVIQIPRPQSSRLGSVGDTPPPPIAWTTISASVPDTTDNWLAYKLREQAHARETTPGTLQYTPAETTPPPIVAPWNAWYLQNCPGAQQPVTTAAPAAPAAPPAPDYSKAYLAMGAIGTIAALAYLMSGRK